MTSSDTSKATVKYNEIVCVGLGLSGICLGAQLRRKWNFRDMHFYDRNESHSGTWFVNHYPGAACDVPIFVYAFSFAQGQPWSRLLPGYAEIRNYVSNVVSDYDLQPHMSFQTECKSAVWNHERSVWSLKMQNLSTGENFIHECRILFSAVGLLSQPYTPEIPGAETFKGDSFHTARWKDEVSVAGKDVVVLGNGCSACQVIPVITPEAKSVTQIFRTPHWLLPFRNFTLSPTFLFALKSVPLLVRLLRLAAFISLESNWIMFWMNSVGERMRRSVQTTSRNFVIETAPEKYHKYLVPDFPVACKRRIYDSNSAYLKALHSDNILLTKETVTEIKPNGVLTDKSFYPADIIVYATGFKTNKSLGQLRIKGDHGVWLDEHWKELGGPSAYNCVSVPDYPNFFMLYGPNSNTGHMSVTVGVENAISGALKLIAPLLDGRATKLTVRRKAYEEWTAAVQNASKGRVFNRETCTNWYVSETGWNGTTYPWSQIHFWWRSAYITWNDWEYTHNGQPVQPHTSKFWMFITMFLIILSVGAVATIKY